MSETHRDSVRSRVTHRWYLAAGIGVAVGWLASASPCIAGVLYISGQADLIAPPASVDQNVLTDNSRAVVFEERTGYVLPVAVGVEWDASLATNGDIQEGFGFFPGVIPAGTAVDSFFFHFDTVGQTLGYNSTTIFTDAPILGVALIPPSLDSSDGILGAPGTFYPSGIDFRGTAGEVTESDQVLISPDLMSITIYSTVEAVFDQLRVITAPGVPEPSALALWLATGALGLALGRRRRGVA